MVKKNTTAKLTAEIEKNEHIIDDAQFAIYKAHWDNFWIYHKMEKGHENIHIVFNENIKEIYRFDSYEDADSWNYERFTDDLTDETDEEWGRKYDAECMGETDCDWSMFSVGVNGFKSLIDMGFKSMN